MLQIGARPRGEFDLRINRLGNTQGRSRRWASMSLDKALREAALQQSIEVLGL
ncbi:MAG: hypothetical protein ACOVVK_01070 [Elsteraceae bacterium]